MIPAVIYPLPLDNWKTFEPDVKRFIASWKEFPPGCDCHVFVSLTANGPGDFDNDAQELFSLAEIPVAPLVYSGDGADIGAHQSACQQFRNHVMVCLSTRVHFHRAGWLKRLVDCWDEFGPGLYGTAATREPGRLCLRTHCYMIRSDDFQLYPHVINSRQRGHFFEWGDGNPDGSFTRWYQDRGGHTRVVYWDSCSDMEWLAQDNIFRRGDQSNLLVWDRHTKIYEEADAFTKKALHAMTFGMDTRPEEV